MTDLNVSLIDSLIEYFTAEKNRLEKLLAERKEEYHQNELEIARLEASIDQQRH